MKTPIRKVKPEKPGRRGARTAHEPRSTGGVARRLLFAFFVMAAVPLVVFLALDTLGLGQRILGGLIGDDPANAVLAAAAAAIIAFFLGTRMSRRITTPLGQLAAAAAALSRGELPERLTIDEDDEFGRVAVEETARAVLGDRRPVDGGFSSMGGRLTTAARAAWGPVASAMAAPLMQQGEAIGVIVVGSLQSHRYTDENKLLLSSATTQVAFMLSFSEVFGQVEEGYLQTVTALCGSLEEKDRYPQAHPGTLARHAVAVGRRMGMSETELRQLQYSALLHDVGKADVPGAILDKRGLLSADELAQIRRHTIAGERLVAGIAYLAPAASAVRASHERWDGEGYPDGLSAERIPLAARIVLVCDAFEALTHERPYRGAIPVDQALEELRANAGTQFDPRVVEVFLALGGLAPSEDAPPVAADLAGGAAQPGGASAGVPTP